MAQYTKYVVRTKDCKKYLHTTINRYGTSVSLTEIPEYIGKYDNFEKAFLELRSYLRGKKTMDMKMFEIVEMKFITQDVHIYDALPSSYELRMINFEPGLDKKKDEIEQIKKFMQRDLGVTPISFRYTIEPNPDSPDRETAYKYSIIYLNNIKW